MREPRPSNQASATASNVTGESKKSKNLKDTDDNSLLGEVLGAELRKIIKPRKITPSPAEQKIEHGQETIFST